MWKGKAVAALVILLLTLCAPLPAAAGAPAPASGRRVTGNILLDKMFFGYGDSGKGWTGGDQAYSVALPNGSEVWIFSDTLMGSVVDGARAPFPQTPMIHNCLVLQTGDSIVSTIYQGTHSAPKSLVSPPQAGDWYWFGPGTISGGALQVIMIEMTTAGSGVFGFKWVGTYLATFSLKTFALQGVSPLESSDGIVWSSWLLKYGGFTYIYGLDNQSQNTMYVARVAGTSLLGSWEYFDGSGWSADPASASGVTGGVATTYSVTQFDGRFLLVSMDSNDFFSGVIYAYLSPTPVGPFTHKTPVYTTPAQSVYNRFPGYSVFTYSAMVHPELSDGNTLVMSYSVNGSGPKAFTNASVYRPRFLNFTP